MLDKLPGWTLSALAASALMLAAGISMILGANNRDNHVVAQTTPMLPALPPAPPLDACQIADEMATEAAGPDASPDALDRWIATQTARREQCDLEPTLGPDCFPTPETAVEFPLPLRTCVADIIDSP